MTINPFFFNGGGSSSEQELLEDLIIEYITIYGQEFYYLPRREGNFDRLTFDDDQKYFDTAYPIEMYIKSISGFGGDQTFMSKFDIEIRDQIVFSIARRRFQEEIGAKENFLAPREGDLIYFPMNKKVFQILFSDNKPFFYQQGSLQMFDITCENFEASSEHFSTGIPAIDSFYTKHTQDVLDFVIKDRAGNILVNRDGDYLITRTLAEHNAEDTSWDNDIIEEKQIENDIVSFSESNPYSGRNPY